ncbi:MAG: hypothetical protein ACJAWV_002148 [Flammeovirgaceae bacterium]|jgi:hypothetical protein
MKIIGHHTCSSEGLTSEIEINGPFLSENVENEPDKHKFLGTGYYFWDNNIGIAHSHGQNNYKRKYYIFEAELELNTNTSLDLAGNRIDMVNFQAIMTKLNDINPTTKSWTLGHYIEFLKSKNQFRYRLIRAIDTSIKPKEVLRFVSGRTNHINLNPIFIICLLDKESDILVSFKHVKTFPSHG